MSSKKVIANPKPEKITYKAAYWYDSLIDMLKTNSSVFVSNLTRQSASYTKKRIIRITGLEIESLPAFYEGEDGYEFRIKHKQ